MIWRWLAARLQPHLVTTSAAVGSSNPAAEGLATAPAPDPSEERVADSEPTPERLRELMGQALSIPTPEAILTFVGFAHRHRRMGPYNILMVFTQRPGAKPVASRDDWAKVGQTVRADAIPILILRPKGPITQVFELLDTLPAQERDPRTDALAATGAFDPARLASAIATFKGGKRKLLVDVGLADFGANLAGKIASYGFESLGSEEAELLGAADPCVSITRHGAVEWSVKLNARMTPVEQFATLMHELGNLCCGHVGGFYRETPEADEYGWPDRSDIPHAAKEIEAELVAWHLCDREGLVTGSPIYLKHHLKHAENNGSLAKVELDRVIRAIARIRHHIGDPKPLVAAK